MTRLPAGFALEQLPLLVDQRRLDAEERQRRRARLQRGGAGQRRDEDAAGLRLPPRVDDGATLLADHAVVPLPGFRIDRLADAAEQAQRGAIAAFDEVVAGAHQRADRGRRRVEDVDLPLVDDVPEARHGRVVRHAFEHQRRRAVGERAVQDVAVARHPADVGRAPVDIAVVVVEHVLMRQRGIDEVAARGVQHALRLAGRARRVEDEQRVLGVHLDRRAIGRDLLQLLVQPEIAARRPRHGSAGAAHDQHLLVALARLRERLVGVLLQRDRTCRRARPRRR